MKISNGEHYLISTLKSDQRQIDVIFTNSTTPLHGAPWVDYLGSRVSEGFISIISLLMDSVFEQDIFVLGTAWTKHTHVLQVLVILSNIFSF